MPTHHNLIWLDNAKIIAAFAVIFLHVAADIVLNSPVGSFNWWFGNVYDALVRWCVPVFVMISGAQLLSSQRSEDLRSFYRKRMSRIFIPMVFWSCFYVGWTAVKGFATGQLPTSSELLLSWLTGKPYFHLWFLYMIVVLYLVTPFLRGLIRQLSRVELKYLLLITFPLAALNQIHGHFSGHESLFTNWFLAYIPYILTGYWIATDTDSRLPWKAIFVGAVVATASGCYGLSRYLDLDAGLYFYKYLSMTVIPMAISVMYLCKHHAQPLLRADRLQKLAQMGLGVYLIHPFFLDVFKYLHLGPLDFHAAVVTPLLALATFGVSLGGIWIIERIPYLNRTV